MVCTSTSGEDMRRKLYFNDRGQVIGSYSSKFASDLGTLVRQHVPIVIDRWEAVDKKDKDLLWELVQHNYIIEESQRDSTLLKMGTYWRQYKSSITRKIFEAIKNGEMPNCLSGIRPGNIKSDKEWETFVKGRLSSEFKAKSEKFKEIRKKQKIVHTMSGKGYARLEDEMKKEAPVPSSVSRVAVWTQGHMTKKGEPVNEAVGEAMAKLQELTQSMSTQQSNTTIRDDAISRVFGPERRGRVRGLGLGATPSRLDAQVQSTGRVKQLEETVHNLQTRFEELEAKLLLKEGQEGNKEDPTVSNNNACSAHHATTVQPHATTVQPELINARCELLDWGSSEIKVVGEGKVGSTDPSSKVHHVEIGANCWKVWVDQVFEKNIPVLRPSAEISVLGDAVGSTTAWPKNFIRLL